MQSNTKIKLFQKYKIQAFRSYGIFFLILAVLLTIFYFGLHSIFFDYFQLNEKIEAEFQLYYLFFSLGFFLIYFAGIVFIYRQIFLPIPQVLKKIQGIRNYQKDDEREKEDYFASLPDFWNLIEEEVIAVAKAISKRQKQADRIRKAIEQILNVFPEATIVVDQESRIKYFNKAFQKIFSLREDTEGGDEEIYLHDIFREPQVLSLIESQDKDGTVKKEIQIIPKSTGSKKYFIVFKTPFAMKDGSGLREQMIIFHDITSAKKTDQMKADFVSNVSHELRTPLMSIQGYIKLLKEDISAKNLEHVDKFIEIIESHVDRLTFLINDLLELSYLESEAKLDKKDLEPKALTQKILKQFSLDLKKGEYNIKESYGATYVRGNSRLIEQIIINLIQNSLRYTPSKTQIVIEWKRRGEQIVLSYSDNGPGISEEHLDRIFERFYRIDPHRSRTRGGTGLGLSIVKHIMQRHGGSVYVNSELGHGLTFECIFPQ